MKKFFFAYLLAAGFVLSCCFSGYAQAHSADADASKTQDNQTVAAKSPSAGDRAEIQRLKKENETLRKENQDLRRLLANSSTPAATPPLQQPT